MLKAINMCGLSCDKNKKKVTFFFLVALLAFV